MRHLTLDAITELKPIRVTFNNGTIRLYFHDTDTDVVYYLRKGHARVSIYGTFRTIRITMDDLLPQGRLAEFVDVLSTQRL